MKEDGEEEDVDEIEDEGELASDKGSEEEPAHQVGQHVVPPPP